MKSKVVREAIRRRLRGKKSNGGVRRRLNLSSRKTIFKVLKNLLRKSNYSKISANLYFFKDNMKYSIEMRKESIESEDENEEEMEEEESDSSISLL